MKIIDVGIGIVLRSNPDASRTTPAQWELLITRRRHDTVFPGSWELPGGEPEPQESIEECVVREISEEVGVRIEVVTPLSDVVHTYAHGTVRLHPRICRVAPGSPPPANLHVAEHRWCPMDRLCEHAFPEANDSIIAELGRALASPTFSF